MTHNDVLRRLRYALDLSDRTIISIFGFSGHVIAQSELKGFLKKEVEPGYLICSDTLMAHFLDGLILLKRGQNESAHGSIAATGTALTNNDILKKLRIALELKEFDIMAVMKLVDIDISKAEITALFRNKAHKNYKECGDQFLRNFLKGLTIRNRNLSPHSS